MYEIHPIQDKDEQKSICELCETEYIPRALAYKLLIDGSVSGVCQFTVGEGLGKILSLAQTAERRLAGRDDTEEMFIMLRAALNFIDLCGVHTAAWSAGKPLPLSTRQDSDRILKMVGFLDNSGNISTISLNNMFSGHCNCK